MDLMLAPFKQLSREYKFIAMNMHNDLPINLVVAINYELLCDVEIIMGLMCMMPMLEGV
jgi:hypothetical protein